MKTETRTKLDKASGMLAKAKSFNGDDIMAPAAIESAYSASILIASAYMWEAEGRQLPQNDNTYHLFAQTIDRPEKHSPFAERIMDTVRAISLLHEAYEPALLNEVTSKDAAQMIGYIEALRNLVEDIIR